MSFESYKPDQGKTSRTLVMLSGAVLLIWGSAALTLALKRAHALLERGLDETFEWAQPGEGYRLDVLLFETPLNPAFLISLLILVIGGLWWWRFLNRPKWADLLIEMETELKKVSWPTASDAWQSTLIVTGFTAVLVGTMFVYDVVIRMFLGLWQA